MNRERLRIPADLDREVDDLLAQLPKRESVTVSVGAKSGKVRRNSTCPCGSGMKYKKCCLDYVNAGHLPKIQTKGRAKAMPTRYAPPKKISKFSDRYEPPESP